MGWDGMGWDGMGWDGMGWDGMGFILWGATEIIIMSILWKVTSSPRCAPPPKTYDRTPISEYRTSYLIVRTPLVKVLFFFSANNLKSLKTSNNTVDK
jgi:hypothetical protein